MSFCECKGYLIQSRLFTCSFDSVRSWIGVVIQNHQMRQCVRCCGDQRYLKSGGWEDACRYLLCWQQGSHRSTGTYRQAGDDFASVGSSKWDRLQIVRRILITQIWFLSFYFPFILFKQKPDNFHLTIVIKTSEEQWGKVQKADLVRAVTRTDPDGWICRRFGPCHTASILSFVSRYNRWHSLWCYPKNHLKFAHMIIKEILWIEKLISYSISV